MPNSISTHISSLVGVAVAAIAVFHPGFSLTTAQESIIVSIGTGGALVLQLAHINLKGKALQFAHELQMLVAKVEPAAKVVAPVVEAEMKQAEAPAATA